MNFFTKLFNSFFEYLNKSYILLHPENLPSGKNIGDPMLDGSGNQLYKKKSIF